MIPMFRSGYELGRRNEFRYSRMALGAVFEGFDISDRRTITDNEWGIWWACRIAAKTVIEA